MNGKAKRTKKQVNVENTVINIFKQEELVKKANEIMNDLRACSKSFPCGKISKKAEERR